MPSKLIDKGVQKFTRLAVGARLRKSLFKKAAKSTLPNSTQPLDKLVDDVLIYMGVCYLTTPDLAALTLVSWRCNAIFTPCLYEELYLLEDASYISSSPFFIKNITSMIAAQQGIFKTLETRPHLKRYTKRLAWQVANGRSLRDLYKLIATMENVRYFHIITPYGSPAMPGHDVCLRREERPVYTSVFLQGCVLPRFAYSVLSPTHLTHLTIDSKPAYALPILRGVAMMSFSRLTHLCLRAPSGSIVSMTLLVEFLSGWERVLSSLRETLEEVTLASRSPQLSCQSGQFWRTQPTAAQLEAYVLPVFSRVEFPRLQKLTLEGHLRQSDGVDIKTLSSVIPSVVVIHVVPTEVHWYDHV